MQHRRLGKTNYQVSEIGLGCWQLGGDFGAIDDQQSSAILDKALADGVDFWDTADVYGGGQSESRVGAKLKGRTDIKVATKVGRNGSMFRRQIHQGRRKGEPRRLGQTPWCRDHRPGAAALRTDQGTGGRRHLRLARRSTAGGADPLLRRQRRNHRAGLALPQKPRTSRRCRSSSTCSGRMRQPNYCRRHRRPMSASSCGCRWRAGCCPASSARARNSRPKIIAITIATARRSRWARPSPACRLRSASTGSRTWSGSTPPAGRCRSRAALAARSPGGVDDHRRCQQAGAARRQRRGRRRGRRCRPKCMTS